MTVSTELRVVRHIGNGSTTVFPYAFEIPASGDAVVIVETIATGARTTIGSGSYSISGLGNPAGGSVTYPLAGSALSSAFALIIVRDVDYTQDLDVTNQDGFYPDVVEDQLDDIVFQIQQLAEGFERTIRAPVGDAAATMELPAVAGRASKTLGFDASGNVAMLTNAVVTSTAFYGTKADVEGANTSADWVRTVGYTTVGDGGGGLYKKVASEPSHTMKIQSGAGTWYEYVPENGIVNVRANGALGDGTTDDHTAIDGAISAFTGYTADANEGLTILIPPTTAHYKMSSTLNLKHRVRLIGGDHVNSNATLVFDADTRGIIVNTEDTLNNTTLGSATTSASRSQIENLSVKGSGTDTDAHGIWLRATAYLSNVLVAEFPGDGIRVQATAGGGGALEGNANQSVLLNCKARTNGLNGIHFSGDDANACSVLHPDCVSNGRFGIKDGSLLGNFFFGCHVNSNGDSTDGDNGGTTSSRVYYVTDGNQYHAHATASDADLQSTTPGTDPTVWVLIGVGGAAGGLIQWQAAQPVGTYHAGGSAAFGTNVNARSFVSLYSESGQAPTYINQSCMLFGGIQAAGVYGEGLYFTSNNEGMSLKSPLVVDSERSTDSRTGTDLKVRNAGNVFWEAGHDDDDPAGLRLVWNNSNNYYEIKHSGLDARTFLRFASDLSSHGTNALQLPGTTQHLGAQELRSETVAWSTAVNMSVDGAPIKKGVVNANATVTITDAAAGTYVRVVHLEFEQTGTGNVNTWVNIDRWKGGTAPTLSGAAGTVDRVELRVLTDGDVEAEYLGQWS